jgi:acetoin utilization deacetylase AcuC-like enzyme
VRKVAYVDLGAHHGDGLEAALHTSTISIPGDSTNDGDERAVSCYRRP